MFCCIALAGPMYAVASCCLELQVQEVMSVLSELGEDSARRALEICNWK